MIQLGPANSIPALADYYEELRGEENVEDNHLVRRLVGARGPTPRSTFFVFAFLAGTVCLLETVKTPSLPLAAAPSKPAAPALSLSYEPLADSEASGAILESQTGLHHWKPLIILSIVVVVFLGLWLRGSHWLGAAVRAYIESTDKKLLGTDVTLEKVSFHPCTLKFKLKKLVVRNPEPFKADHLLKVENFTVDVNMWKLLTSKAREIEVEKLTLEKVDAIVEYNSMLMGGSSNLQKVLDHMNKGKYTEGEQKQAAARKVTIRKVDIIDVGAMLQTKLLDPRIEIGDIHYLNFTEETGGGTDIDDIVCTLFKSLGKTIAANVSAKPTADTWA